MYYVAIIIGATISLLFGLNEAVVKPEYKTKFFFKQNLGSTLLNIICGCVLVYAGDEISAIYPITFLSSVNIGLSGQFVFKKIAKIFDNENKTLIGINDKNDNDKG